MYTLMICKIIVFRKMYNYTRIIIITRKLFNILWCSYGLDIKLHSLKISSGNGPFGSLRSHLQNSLLI